MRNTLGKLAAELREQSRPRTPAELFAGLEFEELPQYAGYSTAPNPFVNVRDNQGNYYYRDDDSGIAYRWVGQNEGDARWVPVHGLSAPASYNEQMAQRDSQAADLLQQRYRKLMLSPEYNRIARNNPEQARAWLGEQRARINSQVRQELRGTAKPDDLGLFRLDRLQEEAGGPVYFRNGSNEVFVPGPNGPERLSMADLHGPVASPRIDRYERQFQDPAYVAAVRRAYQATGEEIPASVAAQLAKVPATPEFEDQVYGHGVQQRSTQHDLVPDGTNLGELRREAIASNPAPKPVEPEAPNAE